MAVKIISAILIFGILVAIHELGHFTVAKLCGIQVNEFAIGMGPRLFKLKKGETVYSLRCFPIGGFCAMEGEDDSSDNPRAFNNKSVPKRMAVIVAGATMNIILGFILVIITTCMQEKIPELTIAEFHDGASSHECGLEIGDEIISVNGMNILTDSDISYKLSNTKDDVFNVIVKRNGKKIELENVKFYYQYQYYVDEESQSYVKVDNPDEYTGEQPLQTAESRFDFYVDSSEKGFFNVLEYSAKETASIGRLIWISLIDIIKGKYGISDMSGPVGLATAIGQATDLGIGYLLNLITFITINLGIFNLLPLPALDGGRFVFLIIEAVRRKPIPPEKEGMIHFVGLALFMLLTVVVTFSDIKKLL
jgi:regulator of sigma E protease